MFPQILLGLYNIKLHENALGGSWSLLLAGKQTARDGDAKSIFWSFWLETRPK
jgi:hypothetical protein